MTAREFIEALPERLNKLGTAGDDTVFHFDVPGEDGGQYTLEIKAGKAAIQKGLVGDPVCVVKVKDEHLVGIIKGDLNPMMAMMSGKLKVSNLSEMMKYSDLFKA